MGVTRYVNLAFVACGFLAWIVLAELFAFSMDLFGSGLNKPLIGVNFRIADLVALVVAVGATIYTRRHDQISTFAMEVGNELSKVTWPSWDETRLSTIVVIIATLIISLILATFDYIWSFLSSFVYNV